MPSAKGFSELIEALCALPKDPNGAVFISNEHSPEYSLMDNVSMTLGDLRALVDRRVELQKVWQAIDLIVSAPPGIVKRNQGDEYSLYF